MSARRTVAAGGGLPPDPRGYWTEEEGGRAFPPADPSPPEASAAGRARGGVA